MAERVELLEAMEGIMSPTVMLLPLPLIPEALPGLIVPNIPFSLQTQSAKRQQNDSETDIPVSGGTTVVEGGVGVVNNLIESEVLVVSSRSEGSGRGLVAKLKLRGLGDGVVVGTPDELDGVTDGRVDGERHVAEHALGGCNDNGVGGAGAGGTMVAAVVGVVRRGRRVSRRGRAE